VRTKHPIKKTYDEEHSDYDENDASQTALRRRRAAFFNPGRPKLRHKSDGNKLRCVRIGKVTRRALAVLTFGLAACGKEEQMPADVFPENAAGGWRRVSVRDENASEAPDPVPRNSIAQLRVAQYEGKGKLQARVYRLTSAEVGAALAGRWRPSADTVFFDRRSFFVVVKWDQAERAPLQEFLAQLQKKLGPPPAAPVK
jgi:hypothetical protein